jgi:hypothetical protein
MCCSKRQQRSLQQQEFFESKLPLRVERRGCCGSRKQRNLLGELERHHQALEVTQAQPQGLFLPTARSYHCPMAGILAVSIGLGAEKLGRKISEKRLERKEKKAAEVCLTFELVICFTYV